MSGDVAAGRVAGEVAPDGPARLVALVVDEAEPAFAAYFRSLAAGAGLELGDFGLWKIGACDTPP